MRRFNLGDMVWSIRDDKVGEWKIWQITETVNIVTSYQKEGEYPDPEHKVFATKQELLDSL